MAVSRHGFTVLAVAESSSACEICNRRLQDLFDVALSATIAVRVMIATSNAGSINELPASLIFIIFPVYFLKLASSLKG